MVNLFELAARITLDKKDFDSGLRESESRMSRFGSGIGKVLKTTIAVSGAVAAAGTAAFAKITKSALFAAGELEQGLGGAEAVFGKWSQSIIDHANEAAEKAGVSVNDYLATANKMGSLLRGVGYSQMDAAQLAEDAIQRAADVASIMGIDITSAMESITGAMKGNFTMMDNLGVAINDTTIKTYAASKGMSKSAIDSMTTAQKVGLAMEMFMNATADYAGNYAKENDTLAGSITTLKAVWSNFISGAGGDNAPEVLGSAIDKAADIAVTSLGQIVPRLSKGLNKVLTSVGGKLPQLMETLLPGVEEGVGAIIDLLGNSMPYLLQTAVNLAPSIISGIGKVFVKVGQKAPEMLKGLWNGVKNAGKQIGGMIFGMDGDNVKWPTWDDVKGYAATAWDGIKKGAKTIADWAGGLVFGKKEDGSVDWPDWPDLSSAAADVWGRIKNGALSIANTAGALVFGKKEDGTVNWPEWSDVSQAATDAWNSINEGLDTLGAWVFGKRDDGATNWPTWKDVGEAARSAWDGIAEGLAGLVGTAKKWVFGDAEGTVGLIDSAKTSWQSFKQTVHDNVIDFASGITGIDDLNVVEGIVSKIASALTTILEFAAALKAVDLTTKAGGLGAKLTQLGETAMVLGTKFGWALELAAAFESVKDMIQEVREQHTLLGKDVDWLYPEEERLNKEAKSPLDSVKESAEAWFQQNGTNWVAYTQWIDESIVKPCKDAWNDVSTWFSGTFIPGLASAWDGITSGVNSAIAAVETAWGAVVGWFEEHIIAPIRNLWGTVTGWFGGGSDEHHPSGGGGGTSFGGNTYFQPTQMFNAKGLSYVPYDNYRTRLHRGEMVLNRSRADDYRNGKNNGSLNLKALTTAVASAVRAGMEGVNFDLDGRSVAQNTSARQSEDQMAWRFAV